MSNFLLDKFVLSWEQEGVKFRPRKEYPIRKGKNGPTPVAYITMENRPLPLPDFSKLDRQFRTLQEYREFSQLYNGAIREVQTKLDILDEEFKVRYEHNPIHHMEFRQKTVESMMGKLYKKEKPISLQSARENLYDIAGIRVICFYIDDIYRLANMLTSQGDITLVRTRDYIAHPKKNGYRSLHLVVKVPVFLSRSTELVPVEIQIRTIAMDFWASLEHQLRYKSGEDVSAGIPERLARCAETSAMLDLEMQDIYHAINGFGGLEPAALSPQLMKLANEFYESSKKSSEEE